MKIHSKKTVNQWNDLMCDLGLEYLMITDTSELVTNKEYYNITENISAEWMIEELNYWLSCYYEEGNCRCDDRLLGKEEYNTWKYETQSIKKLITFLKRLSDDYIVVEWK